MKLRTLRERELIAAIRKEFSARREGLILGIGDDAAVIKGTKKSLLLTTDLLVEDVHFLGSFHSPYYLGRKSLNVNLSDIAAMGSTPKFALLGLALGDGVDTEWVQKFFLGLKEAARDAQVELVGGDVSASKKTVISITIIAEGNNFIPRNGAKPGDLIFVSGWLGDAAAGLDLLKKGFRLGKDKKAESLLRAFLDPIPQLVLGKALARQKIASAMIDMSDGLSSDLTHICQESQVGAEVYLEELPLSAEIRRFQKKPENLALHGGEDYHLLFTVAARNLLFLTNLQKKFKLHCIGKITREKGIFLTSKRGKKLLLEMKGFEHFASTRI